MLEPLGDLALREPAPVRELDHRPLVLGQDLERPVDAPRRPCGLGLVRRIGLAARAVLELGDRLGRAPEPVRDRVPRDRVEPGRAATARRVVRARGAPDRDERVLGRVLCAAAIAEPPQREPEHGARVAAVQLVERTAVAARATRTISCPSVGWGSSTRCMIAGPRTA